MSDYRLRRRERLRSRTDYARVFARRCRAGDGALLVYVDRNGLDWSRLGLSVGRRVGGAPVRNRVRRRLREAFRHAKCFLPGGLDILCVATSGAAEHSYDISKALDALVKRAILRLGEEYQTSQGVAQ